MFWYEKAVPGLSGLAKKKVEMRLAEAVSRPRKSLRPKDAMLFNGHYYKVFRDEVTWHEAKRRCEAMGGYLVCITSQMENNFVSQLGNRAVLWLGASDEEREGQWKWVSGEPFQYANWVSRNPSNSGRGEHWLSFSWLRDRGRGWNDNPEGGKMGFVCEWDE
jgi:hypothetical protein